MKRKFLIGIISMILCVALFAGCDSNAKTDATELNTTEEGTEQVVDENAGETNNGKSATLDKSLTGTALYEAMQALVPPKGVILEKQSSGSGEGFFDSTGTTYVNGKSYRIETDSEYGTSVLIYNDETTMSYIYTEGESYAFSVEDADSYIEYDSMLEEVPEDYEFTFEEYLGWDVLYFEEASVEDGQDYLVKLWFSYELMQPMKFEVYVNGELYMTDEVLSVSTNNSFDDSLFELPEGLEVMSTDDIYSGVAGGEMQDLGDLGDLADLDEDELADLIGEAFGD